MPGIDGLELIQNIRKLDKTTPIILTTGSYENLDKLAESLGINKVVKKPWGFNEMLEVIQTTLS